MPNSKSVLSVKTALFVTLPLLFSATTFAASNPVTSTIVFTAKVSTVSCIKSEISNQQSSEIARTECNGGLEMTSLNYTKDEQNNLMSFNI